MSLVMNRVYLIIADLGVLMGLIKTILRVKRSSKKFSYIY